MHVYIYVYTEVGKITNFDDLDDQDQITKISDFQDQIMINFEINFKIFFFTEKNFQV